MSIFKFKANFSSQIISSQNSEIKYTINNMYFTNAIFINVYRVEHKTTVHSCNIYRRFDIFSGINWFPEAERIPIDLETTTKYKTS